MKKYPIGNHGKWVSRRFSLPPGIFICTLIICIHMFSEQSKYWIVVASRDHVRKGVEEGFCQANHGKEAPLRRMKKGDWVAFYSPKERFGGADKCRRFTAIGRISDDQVYQGQMGQDFSPFRRNVEFLPSSEVPIEPLILQFSFIRSKKSWGYVFKFGLIQIPRPDFLLIADQMLPAIRETT